MKISNRSFGCLPDGRTVTCWTLTNDAGLQTEILDYGVTIRTLVVPDRTGKPVDVVLGYDTLEEYVENGGYFGATIGRFANRIGGGRFTLNGVEYQLYAPKQNNHSHGGKVGFDKHVWSGKQVGDAVVFSRISPDGEEGYPGTLQVQVEIGWKGNALELRYRAETDKDTILNLTNHSYFNLNGHGSGDVHGHVMQINADHYNVGDEACLPTGELGHVEGTAMDFRVPKTLGQDIDRDEPCVKPYHGYDSNYIISGHPVAVTTGDKTGIVMVTDTDQPGVQLYTANTTKNRPGKNGTEYGPRGAFCLETQHYPDCIHHPEWPSCILRADEVFESVTSYAFSV